MILERIFFFHFLKFFFLSSDRFSTYHKGHIHQGDAPRHQILHDVRRIDYSPRLLGDDCVDSVEQTHLHNQTRGKCIYYILYYVRVMETRRRQWNTINCGGNEHTHVIFCFFFFFFFLVVKFLFSSLSCHRILLILANSDSVPPSSHFSLFHTLSLFLYHLLSSETSCPVNTVAFELMKRTSSCSFLTTYNTRWFVFRWLFFTALPADRIIYSHTYETQSNPITVSPLFQMYHLRKLSQGSVEHPKAPLGNNSRPTQDLRERTVRTNINFAQRTEADPQVRLTIASFRKKL